MNINELKLSENDELLRTLETIYDLLDNYRKSGSITSQEVNRLRKAIFDYIRVMETLGL